MVPEKPLGPHSSESTPFARTSPEWRGLKFARNRCSTCHGVEQGQVSANPDAPTFMAIANTPGIDRAGLSEWLKDEHDFPDAMYFAVPDEHIDDLVAYVMTLRSQKPDAGA
nr:cytochrome c [Qipengyuania sphaerica]